MRMHFCLRTTRPILITSSSVLKELESFKFKSSSDILHPSDSSCHNTYEMRSYNFETILICGRPRIAWNLRKEGLEHVDADIQMLPDKWLAVKSCYSLLCSLNRPSLAWNILLSMTKKLHSWLVNQWEGRFETAKTPEILNYSHHLWMISKSITNHK